jgi:hypothetical protein
MRNINRYKTDTRPIKDAMHWPLTDLDNEYTKLRYKKKTGKLVNLETRCLGILGIKRLSPITRTQNAIANIQNTRNKEISIAQLKLC